MVPVRQMYNMEAAIEISGSHLIIWWYISVYGGRKMRSYNVISLLLAQAFGEKRFFFLGHLSHSGNLLLWFGVRRRPSCVVRRPSCIFFSRATGPIFTTFGMQNLMGKEIGN